MTTTARRPWVAFIFSLLLSGLGQLYSGRIRVALLFMGSELLLWLAIFMAVTTWLSSAQALPILALILVASLSIKIIGLIDAVLGARRAGSFAPAWFNRWYVYVLLLAGFYVVGGVVDSTIRHSLKSYRIPSASMTPTVQPGDYVAARLLAYRDQPMRCDVVTFTHGNTTYIKRIVANGGDEVQYRDGRLYLNGVMVPREQLSTGSGGTVYRETMPGGCSYEILEQSDQGGLDNTPPYRVPAGAVFALGDNRDNSADSRIPDIGFVPFEQIQGRVLFIFWARDLARIGMLQN
jgi:signal peptidase I